MENLTYRRYLANPAIRERIEREARHVRNEVFGQYIVTPVWSAFSKLFKRASPEFAAPESRHGIFRNAQPRS